MSKSLKKLIDINRLREFKNKLVGAGSAYVQTSAVDQTVAGTKTFSKPIVGSVTGSSGSCTGNAATATKATQDAAGNTITTTYATKAHTHTKAEITDFPTLATVATSGSYTDLANKPAIPTVNNATLTIQKNGTTVKTFTANSSTNVTANITVPTKVSELTNDSGFLTSHQSLSNYVTLNGAQTISGDKTFTGNIIGINKERSTEDANSLYSTTAGSKLTYYTTSNGGTTLTNVPATVNTTLESRTIRRLSDSDWIVEQICHNSHGLYYRKGSNGTWGAWKTFAFTDSNISGNAATATTATTAKSCTGNAATATKLAAARTINGTAFNGTANITTANWGTARNISITDGTNTSTAVSVNGSANVALKLPATIKANLTGNAATATKATQDSAGQQIDTTYIKGLAVSGRTITYTKGDGTTGTITTQDTNTWTAFKGATSSANGTAGYVPAPTKGNQAKFFKADGTWATPPNTTYASMSASEATTGTATAARTISAKVLHDKINSNLSAYATKTELNNGLATKANNSEVVHKSGDETIAGTKTFSDNVHASGFHSTAPNALMAQHGEYTLVLRNDGSDIYLLMSDKGGVPGTWSNARPLVIHNSTGVCNINGNAASATKLQTARTINGTSFNGTANITTANWGTARNISITDGTNTSTAVSVNGSANVALKLPATIKANLTGNAATATKATQDSAGNRISTTYVKKTDMRDLNTGACFIGFYSLVSHIKGVGDGGSLTVGYTTSASNIYDTITANQDTTTLSRNITLAGSWKLISIIKENITDGAKSIGVAATHSPGSSYGTGVLATPGLFIRIA